MHCSRAPQRPSDSCPKRDKISSPARKRFAFDRKTVEATISRNNSEKQLAQIEAAHEARERQIKDHEQARTALTERNNALTKTLKVRETALARSEEKIAALTERNGHLEADIQVSRTNIEKRVEDLSSALQRERMERAVVEGALEAARKDNSRLQGEVGALRSTLRREFRSRSCPYHRPRRPMMKRRSRASEATLPNSRKSTPPAKPRRHDKNGVPPYIVWDAHSSYCRSVACLVGAVGLVCRGRLDASWW